MSRIESGAKWVLFATLLVLFPSFSYMILAIGLLPNSYHIYFIYFFIVDLAHTSKPFCSILLLAICLTHVVVYAFVYRWLSKLIASRISKIQSEKIRICLMLAIIAAIVVASFLFPIYFSGGHGEIGPTNIIGVYEAVVR